MTASRAAEQLRSALAAVDSEQPSLGDKVEMLIEIAMGLQTRPKSPDDIKAAIALYEKALSICPADQYVLRARTCARLGTALQSMPGETTETLERARSEYETARAVLKDHGTAEELAELEMNLGLVLQSLAGINRARITDAIAAYQRSLRTFSRTAHPKEFAILQNNLATAFLSIPFTDERAKMREALAVQAFEEGLKVVNIVDHPSEYAMLQNNLGNALQYVSSAHAVDNNVRALGAYEEALKVRTAETTPLEYANTLANKANCLWNLPDDPERPQLGNHGNLVEARACYRQARQIFAARGEAEKAALVAEALDQIETELDAAQETKETKPNGAAGAVS